jgi:hypothetical protein
LYLHLPDHGAAVLAARARGDRKRRHQQDRYRQRRGNQYDRCFHDCPIAISIHRARKPMVWKIVLTYVGIGIAMLTLIDSAVRVTIRHSDSEPIASEAATASISRDEATGADGLSKPAPDDRIMAEIL